MKKFNFCQIFFYFFIFFQGKIEADTLISSTDLKVTLNLSENSFLSFCELDFGFIDPTKINEEMPPLESTTETLTLQKVSKGTFYVTLNVPSSELLGEDGYTFLMKGQEASNLSTIPFLLKTSYEQDGSAAYEDTKILFPGSILIYIQNKKSDRKNKQISIDLWASLIDNNHLKHSKKDIYSSTLTLNLYSKE